MTSRITFTQRSVEKVVDLHDGLELLATVTWRGTHNPVEVRYPSWADPEAALLVFDFIALLNDQEAATATGGVLGGGEDDEDDTI